MRTVWVEDRPGESSTESYPAPRTQMARMFGAPDDCQLTPFDCVMLEQSIRSYGNEPPEWIKLACRYWLRGRGLTTMHMRPAVAE